MLALRIILAFAISCRIPDVFAQTINAYESISTGQGLSQGMVFDILQDKEGFIWVATKNGLNRYDGYSFTIFTNDPYSSSSLSSNTITVLFEDSKGRIWAGTENAGLNVYDKKTGKFHRINNRPGDPSSLSGNSIRSGLVETPDGSILAAAENAGFNMIKLPIDFFEKDVAPTITRLTLPGNAQVYGMGKDKEGKIRIGTLDRLLYNFDPSKKILTKLDRGALFNNGYANEDGSTWINKNLFLWDGTKVSPLFDLENEVPGNIILNSNQPLFLGFHQNHQYYNIARWQPGAPIRWGENLPAKPGSTVLYPFIVDRSGMLWGGTIGYGLRKYNTAGSRFRSVAPGFSVRFVKPEANGVLLGAYPYEWLRLRNDSLQQNPFSKMTSNKAVDNIIITKNGDYWMRTDDDGLYQYQVASNQLKHYPTVVDKKGAGDKQPMLEDSRGNIWLPMLNSVIILVNAATGNIDSFSINTDPARPLSAEAIATALYEDGAGVFWIGTAEGFAKVVFSGNKMTQPVITWFYNNSNDRNSLNYNNVSCFMDDPAEPGRFIWICTKGGGLNRLDKQTGDFFHLTSKDGLPDDVVYGILPDDAGNIWGSTNRGIFCLFKNKTGAIKDWHFRNYTKADGLQDDEFNTGAYAKLANGNLAFGGVNGLNIFNPTDVLAAGFTPNVFITSMMINNQPIVPGDTTGVLQSSIEQTNMIELNHLQDILTLQFSSLDFTAPNQNKYRYQLVGIDKDWVESGTRRSATYLHLPSGKYTFKVQGSNSQGIWSDKIAELQIKVLPPWWLTWWAYTLYAAVLVFAIWAYFKFTINRTKLRAQLRYEQQEGKRVKELDTIKTQLYTNITHEFRTPLTVILGMAQQVINKPKEHFTDGMDMIIRSGQNLLRLVNELLDLSKLESGKMSLQLVEGDIISFIRYIVESFHSLADSQQKQLHYLSEMDTLYISYDAEKMRQIISNLLSNALKFTPENGHVYITISEDKLSKDKEQSSLIIKVKDTGIGIPEGEMPYIFDRFYQADNSNTRKAEGTGIGLALTRELVKLMQGDIFAKSPPTGSIKGSEFTVVLPVQRAVVTEKNIAHPDLPGIDKQKDGPVSESKIVVTDENLSSKKPLILLVEDNADVVAYIASCLPDYRLAVGKDGMEGLAIANNIIPDLIITDVMMPFADGFELCSRLRNDETTSHIPIIMLTARADIESKMEGLERGADVYLEKPFNRNELLVRIKKLLELRKNLRQYYLKKAGLSDNPVPESAPADLAALHGNVQAEDAFVQKVRDAIDARLADLNFTVEQLSKELFMSHSQLHRKLEALTGCTPNKFIRILRLNKAKALLKNPENSIGMIALDCGYNDPGYFARIFKQENGVTPQEWRLKVNAES